MKKLITPIVLITMAVLYIYCRPKDVIVPVTSKQVTGKVVNVDWTVASPSSISYFKLERLDTTSKVFNQIAIVAATNSLSYSYIDHALYDSLNIYRLKVVLTDSSVFYSTMVK